jgi:nucleoside 2-deoxyribosyltransferase
MVVAIMDGTQVDDGTAWECGYAYAKGKPVIGLRTDFRSCGDGKAPVNLMLSESTECIYDNIQALLTALPRTITRP